MDSSHKTTLTRGNRWRRALPALLTVLGLAAAFARPVAARINTADVPAVVESDSASAVQRSGASPESWRNAVPLAVPDIFGPGAVLGVGRLRMKVINDGTLGNESQATSSDPSGQWPGLSGVEYLYAIQFAVGAVNTATNDPNAVRRVSFDFEWRPPTLNPEDRIYRAYDGIINGKRFENDDGDKDRLENRYNVIDEDFLDGKDNDLDGLIDEDHAALGQQEFSYVIRDDTREAINTSAREKHVPLGLETQVRAWAYSIQGYEDFNVCEYDIRNVSGHVLDSLTVGWLVDMDSGPIQLSPFWTDDIDFPYYPSGEFKFNIGTGTTDFPDAVRGQANHHPSLNQQIPADQQLCPSLNLRVNGFSIGDQDGDLGRTPAMGSFMLIDHTVDPTGANGPRRVQFRSFRSFANAAPYTQGGFPRLDQEKFESMTSVQNIDPTTGFVTAQQGAARGDYAAWCSIGPWRNVQPGQVITATIAFGVAGKGSYTGTPAALANQYPVDYERYKAGNKSLNDLVATYPTLANALAAQIAFEGIHIYPTPYPETQSVPEGGRDFHGRETGIKLPNGATPVTITEDCSSVGRERREKIVTDREYSWFDFDCDYCTGVWNYGMPNQPPQTGLFHKTWNASAPPPNPNTNVSSLYNFSDNPTRTSVPSSDKAIKLAWDNLSEVSADPKTTWLDFRGYNVWKVADWTRPVGSAGPNETDWRLLGEFRIFDYYAGVGNGAAPFEHNYTRDADGAKVCPLIFIPNYYDPDTKLYGKAIPVCLDRFDLFNRQTGEIVPPNWKQTCETDSAGAAQPLIINSGDLEFAGPQPGGSYTQTFPNAGTFRFLCLRHPTQVDSLVVSAAADSDSTTILVGDDLPEFSEFPHVIRPGGSVRWQNVGQSNHAVQSDRNCKRIEGLTVGREDRPVNREVRIRYPVGRYEYVDKEVKNGFLYFYSVTAFDSTTVGSTTELGGRRSAVEAEGVTPEAVVDAHGKQGVWVVPNPYRGYARIQDRPSSWDLTPNASDPTGTHVDFMGLPSGQWTIRIYTVSGDLVQEMHSTDAINASVRQDVRLGNTVYPGFNRQQDNPNDGQARWNLISRNGQDIVSGIYIFTVESSEGSQKGKFVVIR